ncbi:ABC transporter substrate-binding protein [Occultella kanbiaonis]|uniref:ABC transporter substrate-binding protein n=1 Tax=Occultella kanbiaonis TaxID=2675754 RepID=UPI0013D307DE|nr:ABC transporter substrate-binding protein [Occultella kanbiaonis]
MLTPTRRTTLAAALLGALGATGLTGCTSAVQQQDSDRSDAAEPVSGGTLTIAQSADIQLDNLQASRAGNGSFAANVFETLTVLDADGVPQPRLAETWEMSDDQISISLRLRSDVTFHSGRPLTAEDVKFTLEQVATSSAQLAFIAQKIEAIEVTGSTELELTFSEPIPNVFDLFEQTFIVDAETFAGLADGTQVIGTGPFLFEEWVPGSSVSLVRNDDYWGEPAYLDNIEIAVITDSTALLNAVRSNRSQIGLGMNMQDIITFAEDPAFSLTTTSGSIFPLGLDVENPVFETREMRQAVNFAIDRERIATQVFGDAGTATALPWPVDSEGYPSGLADTYAYDLERARQMIQDAGAQGAEVTLTVNALPQNLSIAEVIRNNLEEAGLVPTIAPLDSPAFNERQIAGDLGMSFLPTHGLDGLTPITLLDRLPSIREGNSSHFWSDEYERLRQDLVTSSEADYAQALEALSQYMLDEAFAVNVVYVENRIVVAGSAQDTVWSARGYLDAKAAFVNS